MVSREIAKFCFQAVDTPGGDGFTTLHSGKNIWLLFDVDKLPDVPKTKLVRLALSVFFFPGAKNQPQILFKGERHQDGLQVMAPSYEGMAVGGVMGSKVAERERAQTEEG